MHLIVGLGNPGARYRNTRHNVGFMLADRLAARLGASFGPSPARALAARAELEGEAVVLAKPRTYMNLSGESVGLLLEWLPVELERLLVVYDEIALPLGRIRLRRAGSAGGQKGMRSIIQALGTREVPRLRIGILQGEHPPDVSEYVLSDFPEKEAETVDEVLERAADCCQDWIRRGIESAMSMYNA